MTEYCPHCSGYGSSLKDPDGVDTCTVCGGSGLASVKVAAKPGDRIELIEMAVDPVSGKPDPCPIEPGTKGTVMHVSAGLYGKPQISVNWDVPRTLMLIEGVDRYRVISDGS